MFTRVGITILLLVSLAHCKLFVASIPPADGITEFSDNFDDTTNIEDLFPASGSRWSNAQLVEPDGSTSLVISGSSAASGDNTVTLQQAVVASAPNALRTSGPPNAEQVSKADVWKSGFYFGKGDDFWASFAVYVADASDIVHLFLFDLESSHTSSLGRRIKTVGVTPYLKLEGKAFTGPEYSQPQGQEVPFPTGRWVPLVIHLHLSNGADGRVRLWQDGTLVIDESGKNLPWADTIYDRVQVGMTANGASVTQRVYIDDLIISAAPLN